MKLIHARCRAILTALATVLLLTSSVVMTQAQGLTVLRDIGFYWNPAICVDTCVGGVAGYRLYTASGELLVDTSDTVYVSLGYPIVVGEPTGFYVTAYNGSGEGAPSPLAFIELEGTPPVMGTLTVIFE